MTVFEIGKALGSRGLVEAFLKGYATLCLFTLEKRATEGCLICAKVNNQVIKEVARGGHPWDVCPFQ